MAEGSYPVLKSFPTGIESIRTNKDADGMIFNLNGQRVEKAVKGIYIIDGKKILVK